MSAPSRRPGGRARAAQAVLVPLFIALLGTLAVAAVAWRWHSDERDRDLEEQITRVDRIGRTVDQRLAGLRSLAETAAVRWAPRTGEAGTREQWSAELAAAQGAEPSLIAIVYAEHVSAADQEAVQARYRAETGLALSLEPGTDSTLLTRGAPSAVLGFDLTDNELLAPILSPTSPDLTVTTVDPTLIGLAGSESQGPVVLLAVPDRSQGGPLRGHALVAFAGGGLARGVQGAGRAADGVRIATTAEPPTVLGEVDALGGSLGEPVLRGIRALEPEVAATTTITPLVTSGPTRGPLVLAGAGAVLSLLLGALLFTVSRSRDRAEAAVVQATEELKGSEQRMQALVRHAADVIIVVDGDGRITFLSPSAEAVFGQVPATVLGRHVFDVDAADGTRRTLEELGGVPPGETLTRETVLHRADGSPVHVRVTVTNLLADPAVRGYVANIHDISDHKAFEALLSQQAREDALTGLANRAQLDELLAGARDRSESFAVLFVDLDGFKTVNDDFGHDAGDEVLRQLAQRLRAAVRAGDEVVRLGGDEFVVVAPGCDGDGARRVAAALRACMEEPFGVDGRLATVGASVGIAVGGPATTDLAALVREADLDMYRTKLAGRSG